MQNDRKEGICRNQRGRNKPLGGHRVGPVGEGWDSVEVHRVGEMKGSSSRDQLCACEDVCILVKVWSGSLDFREAQT